MGNSKIAILIFLLIPFICICQTQRETGKIIEDFGPTFSVLDPDIKTDTTATLKVIFDVSQSGENKNEINKYIETAARFLNMHAAAGMEPEQLNVAMTIHGGAWHDVLKDEMYQQAFGFPNPNTELINALSNAGVEIILCGQTAGARGISREDVNPNIKLALSAMTALLQYQNMGYKFIKF